MDKNLDYTMKFEGISEEKLSIKETLEYVYEALDTYFLETQVI